MSNQEEWSFSLLDKLAGELNENEIMEFEQEMAQNKEKKEEFEFFSSAWEDMSQLDDASTPSASLSENFYAKLNEIERNEQSISFRIGQQFNRLYRITAFKGVAVLAILLCGIGAFMLNNTKADTEEYASKIMQYSSNTEKIRAINSIYTSWEAEDAVKELQTIVQEDNNLTVRLAAIHQLSSNYANISMNRFLEKQIKEEQSPMVQVELLNLMMEQNKTKESIRTLEDLLNQKQLNPLVQEKIQKDIPVLRASFSK